MTRLPRIGAYAALAALVVAWWATRFAGYGERLDLDALLYFLPTYAATWSRLRAGVLPLWNPYQLCGIPWIGTLQGGTFYPFHVVYGFLPLNQALAVSGALHLVIAATATAAFVRRLGLGAAPALLAAVVFALRGEVAAALVAPNLLEALAWLPVGAVAIADLVRAPGRRAVALLAAATALSFLAGYPQPTVYVVYAWASLFLALLVHERPSLAGIAARVGTFGGALALGAAVAAVQLVPALELLQVGTRDPQGLTDQTMFPISAFLTPGMIFLRGHAISGSLLAFGLFALAIAPAAVLARDRRAIGWWAVGLAVLTMAWSLGRYTRLFDLYLALPALRLFRNPQRMLFVTNFAIADAAALGLATLTDEEARGPRRRLLPIAVMALALLGLGDLIRLGWAPKATPTLVAFAVAACVAIVALVAVTGPRRRAIGWAIAVVAAIEIACNPWFDFRLPYTADDVAVYRKLDPDFRRLAELAPHDRVWRARTDIDVTQALKLSTWYRLRSLTDYEPVNLQRQSDYFTYFVDGSVIAKRRPWLFAGDITTVDPPPGGTGAGARHRLLDVAAVRFVTFARGMLLFPEIATFVRTAGLGVRERTEHLVILENPTAVPRAYATYRVTAAPADADALLAALSDESFDPLASAFVEGPFPFVTPADAPRGHGVTFVRDDETDVELEATLAQPGLVVLADSFYPGWRATIDGEPAPILATNHLFRGVATPAGTHRIRFVYAPASVRLGASVSVAGLVVLAWLGLGRRARG